MKPAKQEVLDILDSLPDDASLEDVQYSIYVRQKIEHGRSDLAAGRTISEEEFDQRILLPRERMNSLATVKRP